MLGNFLGNSAMPTYVKLTATGLIAVTYLAALGVAADEYITYGPNAQLPTIVSFVLGTGIGIALNALGLHTGASLAESVPASAVPPNTTSTTTQTNITKEVGGDASTPTP